MALAFLAASSMRISLGTNVNMLRNVAGGTMMGWVNLRTATGSLMQFSIGGANSPSRCTIEVLGGSWLSGARRLDADGITSFTGPATSTGSWNHLCVVANFTGQILQVYYNGAFVGSTANGAWTANSSNTASGIAHIASEDDGLSTYLDGSLDDVRLYDRALSANEINTIYWARGADTILKELSHRYTMNEASVGVTATTVMDKGNQPALNGTAVNSPTYVGDVAVHRRRRRAA